MANYRLHRSGLNIVIQEWKYNENKDEWYWYTIPNLYFGRIEEFVSYLIDDWALTKIDISDDEKLSVTNQLELLRKQRKTIINALLEQIEGFEPLGENE